MGTLVFSSATSSEIRIRTMECLEHLFKLPPDVQDENLLNLTQVLIIYYFTLVDLLSLSLLV